MSFFIVSLCGCIMCINLIFLLFMGSDFRNDSMTNDLFVFPIYFMSSVEWVYSEGVWSEFAQWLFLPFDAVYFDFSSIFAVFLCFFLKKFPLLCYPSSFREYSPFVEKIHLFMRKFTSCREVSLHHQPYSTESSPFYHSWSEEESLLLSVTLKRQH